MASAGYPGGYEKGKTIVGVDAASEAFSTEVFHAGTKRDGSGILTSGGRVLAVSARGSNLQEALDRAYAGVEAIDFDGATFRRDIGHKGLNRG